MAITGDCTPLCGIRANAEDTVRREGHCGCPQDPGGQGTSWAYSDTMRFEGFGDVRTGVPMCDRRALCCGNPRECTGWCGRRDP